MAIQGVVPQVPSLVALLGTQIALPTRCVCYCSSPTCGGASARQPEPVDLELEPPAAV